MDKSGLPGRISVGSELNYAAIHEFGLGRFPVRAFLKPALEVRQKGMEKRLLVAWRKRVFKA